MKLWEFLKTQISKHSSQTICENNTSMTYWEAVTLAEDFSKKLTNEKCCAILCHSEMMASLALFSCFAAEVTAVPLSLRYGELHCNKILDTINPTAIITDFNGELKITHIKNSDYKIPAVHPALIMCTSGTTGKPKGAMLSEDNVITNIKDISEYFDIDKSDSILIARPLYHCAVLTGELLTGIIKGVKIRFYSEGFNPSKMLQLIKDYNITTFCGTPTLLSMMARFKRTNEDCLKHICISGECMEKETGLHIARAFNKCEIYHIYGLTEACPRVSYLPPELFFAYPDFVGVPLRSVSVRLINFQGNVCSKNEEGVLWVKGGNVMLGYYEEPEKTNQVIHNGWLCTGDIAIINDAGLLKIKGRNDQMIIKSGMNIYPAEVEAAMKTDLRVKEALAFGFENKYGTQIGLKISGDFSSVEQVKQLCTECLPSFQIPSLIEIVDKLPKNGSGKVVRK